MAETILGRKPYDFVPLTSRCDRQAIKEHNNFSEKTYSGKLNITIKTLSPIHINQGVLGLNENETELVNKTMRRAGEVVIPGSSIKGAIRSIAEAISYSCAPDVRIPEALEENNKARCNGKDNKLCPTCSIFGMASRGRRDLKYKGKIKFGEFHLENGKLDYVGIPTLNSPFKDYPKPTDILFRIEKGYGNERLYYCSACTGREKGLCKTCTKENYFKTIEKEGKNRPIKFRGRKFYYHNINRQEMGNHWRRSMYEVVMKDSTFVGSLTFENLTKEELALLVFSLGLDKSFHPKIGYGKPAFYGSIEISLDSVEDLLSRYSKNHNPIDEKFIISLAENYYTESNQELKDVIDKLREILDKDNNAPEWPTERGNKVY